MSGSTTIMDMSVHKAIFIHCQTIKLTTKNTDISKVR